MPREKRKSLHNAPIERFVWQQDDLEIVYDPYVVRKEKETKIADDKPQVDPEGQRPDGEHVGF